MTGLAGLAGLAYTDALHLRAQLISAPLPDGVDRAQFHALLTAGVRDCLFQELDALEDRRHAAKAAAVEVAQSKDWAKAAKRIRDRDEFNRDHPWAARRVVA